jgi:hypothetical protein
MYVYKYDYFQYQYHYVYTVYDMYILIIRMIIANTII